MADAAETCKAAAVRAAAYPEGERGGGGKLRRERKPPATPYDRPSRGRWISRIVDPAKRLFSGLPSLFSSNIVDEVHTEVEHEAGVAKENCSLNPVVSESVDGFARGEDKGKSKLVISDDDGGDKRQGCSTGGIPDIEQLIKGKTFSREEIERLMEILHTRVADVGQDRNIPSMTAPDDVGRAETSNRSLKASLDEEEELMNSQLATPTSLPEPAKQDEICASPVDIARAYMSSRASELGFTSTRSVQKTEKLGSTSDYISNSVMPSPLRKPPICWPGAITQNQQDYATPPSRSYRSGLHSFARTPYSRTVYSKSKSRGSLLNPLRGDNEKFPITSPAPFRPTSTPAYDNIDKVQLNKVAESSYRTGGPIRRAQDRLTLGTPTRDTPLFSTARRSPLARESSPIPLPKKSFERGSSSNTNIEAEGPEAQIHSVHPHSNRLARKILEQLDRPVTLKEQSKELSLAVSQHDGSVQNNSSQSMMARVGVGNMDNVDLRGQTNGESNVLHWEISNVNGAEKGIFGSTISVDNTSSISGFNNGPSSTLGQLDSQRSSEQGICNSAPKTSLLFGDPSEGATSITFRSESQNSQRKPILPSIVVDKPGFTTSFFSSSTSNFTFPITTSSTSFAEPPTPSIIPSFSTSSPPQPKASVPTSNSSNKITIAPPVVAFSSKTAFKPSDSLAPKFNFGSDKPRLSFAVPGDDDTSAPKDAAIPKFTFGSGESRLNFGAIGSDALCY